jgi:hypothetical protein
LIEETSQRLKDSTGTSEELRRRGAMLSQYYENLIRDLQDNMIGMKADLVNQIASMDTAKRNTVEELQSQLREKEEEVRLLRSVL